MKHVTFINLDETEEEERLTFDKPGDYLVFFYNLSGKFIFDIRAERVDLKIYGLFVGSGTEQFTLDTIQHHQAAASTSNLLIKGVFKNSAKLQLTGLIRIEKEAQKSHAYQKNQNLVLSPYCFVESKPYLEILANDVFCTHGSTTGRLNKQQLFYLTTRGLDTRQAKMLLVHGFINEVFDKMRQLIDFRLFQKPYLLVENLLNRIYSPYSIL